MNWRDEHAQHSDYEERERVRGAREVPEPRDTSLHAQVVTEIGRTLPDFHHVTPLRVIPAPAPETPQSKMSIAQLRDRIQGMHATTDLKEREAREDASRKAQRLPMLHRAEKPSERRARAEKLTAYSAELKTREAREAAREQERRTYNARIDADALKRRNEINAAEEAQRAANASRPAITSTPDAPREAPARSAAAQVDPANVPTLVQCNRCNLLVAQDDDGDMIPHLNQEQDECKADPMYWRRPRTNPRHPDQIAKPKHDPTTQAEAEGARIIAAAAAQAQAERAKPAEQRAAEINAEASDYLRVAPAPEPATRKCNSQGCSSQTYDAMGLCSYHRAEYDAAAKRKASEAQAYTDARAAGAAADPIAEAQAKRDAREAIECPQCHAKPGERCTNYSGSHCAPHGVRKPDAKAAAKYKPRPEPTATVTELPPVPAEPAAEIARATAKRKATVQAAEKDTLTALDRAVETLVREHTSGAVIDAAWSAAKRIFRPLGGRA